MLSKNQRRDSKKSRKIDIKIFLKNKKTKKVNMVASNIRINKKMKSKNSESQKQNLSIKSHIRKCKLIKNYYKQRLIFFSIQRKFKMKSFNFIMQI